MLAEMRRSHSPRPGESNAYDDYKCVPVMAPDAVGARDAVEHVKGAGYNLISNNCLHHALAVLRAYGVPEGPNGLKSPLAHPGPNAYFEASFGEGGGTPLCPST